MCLCREPRSHCQAQLGKLSCRLARTCQADALQTLPFDPSVLHLPALIQKPQVSSAATSKEVSWQADASDAHWIYLFLIYLCCYRNARLHSRLHTGRSAGGQMHCKLWRWACPSCIRLCCYRIMLSSPPGRPIGARQPACQHPAKQMQHNLCCWVCPFFICLCCCRTVRSCWRARWCKSACMPAPRQADAL